ncbi:MAG: protein kinase [Candidatus Saganbacteria bacterium]|nr:protein kinase [Candidatus Saganbacteria bacterium]
MEVVLRTYIRAPYITRKLAEAAGLAEHVKRVGNLADGRILVVDDSKSLAPGSMALFKGVVIPPEVETAEQPLAEFETELVVLKVSPYDEHMATIVRETEILRHLAGIPGIPEVVGDGEVPIVTHKEIFGMDMQTTKTARFVAYRYLPGQLVHKLRVSNDLGWAKELKKVELLLTQVLPGLAARLAQIHEKNVVHHDVHPGNALFHEQKGVSVLDFGLANLLGDPPTIERGRGAFGYYPPELIDGPAPTEDFRIDVYGLGVSVFTLVTGLKGIAYTNMPLNPWETGVYPNESVARNYYGSIQALSHLTPERLIAESNLPDDLKNTELGKYLGNLIHPNAALRPAEMGKIALRLQQIGGSFFGGEVHL